MERSAMSNCLGEHLRSRRDELGLTQEQVADRAGVSRSYVVHLEGGIRVPTFRVLVAVCNALEMTREQRDRALVLAGNAADPDDAPAPESPTHEAA